MQHLYALQILHLYKVKSGYYCIDDTMTHHTNYCKWIHGVFVLFDHAFKTNLKAICVVVLYYSNGGVIKCPIAHRIYKQSTAGELTKEPLTVPSIVRQFQCENLEAFKDRVQKDDNLLRKWFAVERKTIGRKRKAAKQLIQIEECKEECVKTQLAPAA